MMLNVKLKTKSKWAGYGVIAAQTHDYANFKSKWQEAEFLSIAVAHEETILLVEKATPPTSSCSFLRRA